MSLVDHDKCYLCEREKVARKGFNQMMMIGCPDEDCSNHDWVEIGPPGADLYFDTGIARPVPTANKRPYTRRFVIPS